MPIYHKGDDKSSLDPMELHHKEWDRPSLDFTYDTPSYQSSLDLNPVWTQWNFTIKNLTDPVWIQWNCTTKKVTDPVWNHSHLALVIMILEESGSKSSLDTMPLHHKGKSRRAAAIACLLDRSSATGAAHPFSEADKDNFWWHFLWKSFRFYRGGSRSLRKLQEVSKTFRRFPSFCRFLRIFEKIIRILAELRR